MNKTSVALIAGSLGDAHVADRGLLGSKLGCRRWSTTHLCAAVLYPAIVLRQESVVGGSVVGGAATMGIVVSTMTILAHDEGAKCTPNGSASALAVEVFLQVLGVELQIAPRTDAADFAQLNPNVKGFRMAFE
jgi:hypothetical protein